MRDAIVEIRECGAVYVHVGGEPLFDFPSAELFFAAHSITTSDLVINDVATRRGQRMARVRHDHQAALCCAADRAKPIEVAVSVRTGTYRNAALVPRPFSSKP